MRTQSGTPDKNQNARRRKIMRTLFLRAILASAVAMLGLSGTARAWDNASCKDATLDGDYAFTVSGQIFLGPLTVSREGVALTHFDGKGGLTQVDFVLSSPNAPAPAGGPPPTDPVTGFHNNETGKYIVNQDCTGSFEIDDPATIDPKTGNTVSGSIIKVMFVLSDHGRGIHTIVYSLIPPGATTPVPALIRSDGHKLGSIDN
jgi:hypothetical protein